MNLKISFVTTLLLVVLTSTHTTAQKYFTRDASVNFNATAKGSPEDIIAKQNSGTIVMDLATGNIQASVLIKGFLFDRALMQEHFNENYMESHKFPKAAFKGQLSKADAEALKKDGTYTFTVKGEMDLHGKQNNVSAPFKFSVKNGKITAAGSFEITIATYGIDIPSLVADKVAKNVEVTISANLDPMAK